MIAMRISLVQTDIIWENAQANLRHYDEVLRSLKGQSDLAVLPEMCFNGFGSDVVKTARYNDDNVLLQLQAAASANGLAVTGSFAAKEETESAPRFFNRGFFIYPDGRILFHDKRHLFRIGAEGELLSTRAERPCIVEYQGWKILLIICYDLRFPVWCRNVATAYDLMICVANWPTVRITSWDNLLEARAIENQAYVCGLNRVGHDGLGIDYNGHSAVFSPIGQRLTDLPEGLAAVKTVDLSREKLAHYRETFPAWRDADTFKLL